MLFSLDRTYSIRKEAKAFRRDVATHHLEAWLYLEGKLIFLFALSRTCPFRWLDYCSMKLRQHLRLLGEKLSPVPGWPISTGPIHALSDEPKRQR
jgi:hypothetical protein